jgi:deferrochelatase/peroxidase EfeB
VGLTAQENMIGRARDTGAPLGGTNEFQDPRYDLDPKGERIPLDAHIRLANPRTPATADQRILRRGFSYHRGFDETGQLDQGLLFIAYNRSPSKQFVVIQNRLNAEPMTDYVTPIGGGYFFVPRACAAAPTLSAAGSLASEPMTSRTTRRRVPRGTRRRRSRRRATPADGRATCVRGRGGGARAHGATTNS